MPCTVKGRATNQICLACGKWILLWHATSSKKGQHLAYGHVDLPIMYEWNEYRSSEDHFIVYVMRTDEAASASVGYSRVCVTDLKFCHSSTHEIRVVYWIHLSHSSHFLTSFGEESNFAGYLFEALRSTSRSRSVVRWFHCSTFSPELVRSITVEIWVPVGGVDVQNDVIGQSAI